jgi:hypothetical protein
MENLIEWAEYYHDLGFKVTHINPILNDPKKKKIYKAPTNNRHFLKTQKQTKNDVLNLDWANSSGIGTVLGCKELRAIDVDFESKYKLLGETRKIDIRPLIIEMLGSLGLPDNYSWVVITPSGGAHVIFKSPPHMFKVAINPVSDYGENKTKAIKPNLKILKRYKKLGHFELRWDLHLVLPPSMDKEGIKYKFWNQPPKVEPLRVTSQDLNKFFVNFCFDVDKNKKGYNLRLNEYHLSHNFLDYTPVIYEH